MERELLSKNPTSKIDENFIKLFPKVSVVKIGVFQNAFDSYLIHKCQDMFSK